MIFKILCCSAGIHPAPTSLIIVYYTILFFCVLCMCITHLYAHLLTHDKTGFRKGFSGFSPALEI